MKERNERGQFFKGCWGFNTGKHPTAATLEKMSLARKGKPNYGRRGIRHSEATLKKLREARLGKTLSEEIKKKISNALRGKHHRDWKGGVPVFCIDCGKPVVNRHASRCRKCWLKINIGTNHPNWRGGMTPENVKIRNSIDGRLWRNAVFARDAFTCQECGKHGGVLNAHHIKGFAQYPELRFAIDNGVTLCESCHKKTNNYGYKKVDVSVGPGGIHLSQGLVH